jgi:hypothetical protein
LLTLVLAAALLPGCTYHYRVRAPGKTGSTLPKGEVVWALAWGLVQEVPKVDNCNDQALAEVHQTSNFAFALITVLTLGFASPQKVEWICDTPHAAPGRLGPLAAGSPAPAAAVSCPHD